MRIAIDIRAIFGPRAGKGEYTFEIVKNLLKIDSHNQFFLYSHQKPKVSFIARPNVRTKCFKVSFLLWHFIVWLDLRFRLKPSVYLAPTSYLIPALGVKNSVIIIPDLVAFLFAEKHNQKAVWLEKIFLRKAVKKAKKIIAISEATKRDLIKILNVPAKKIQVIYLAARKQFLKFSAKNPVLEKVRQKYSLPAKFILFVGTLEPRKNLLGLIRAYQKLSLSSYHLVIVGREGWHYQEISRQVQRLGLQDKVIFLGYVPRQDLPSLYNLAQVFVFPSFYEGFGLPPLEAMACGVPVITSNTSSLPEVVGDAAIQVNPGKVGEIAFALRKVLTNRDLRDKLVRLGREQVKKFNWEKAAKEVLEILEVTANMT